MTLVRVFAKAFFIRHGLQPHCTVLSPRYLAQAAAEERETQENVFLLPTQQKVVYYVLQEDHLVLFMVRSFINSLYHAVFTCMIITLFMGDKSFALIRLDQARLNKYRISKYPPFYLLRTLLH